MSDVNTFDVFSVAGELDSPLCEAPGRYRRVLIGALETAKWEEKFADYFELEVAASSPEELVNHWADLHPNHKHHTIRKLFKYAESKQHLVLLQEFHEILRNLETFVEELSEHIGTDWRVLARALELSKTDIDAIIYRNPLDLKEHIHDFFHKWRQLEGKNASIKKLVSGLVRGKLEGPLINMGSGPQPKVPRSRSISESAVLDERKPKQKQFHKSSVHNHYQCSQQNPSIQHHENNTSATFSTQLHTSSLTPITTENMNSQPSMSPPPSPKHDASSQMPSHEASGGTSPHQVSTSMQFPDEHPASPKYSSATDPPLLKNFSVHSELRQRHKSEDEVKDAPGDSLAVDPEMHCVKAFLQRRCQTKPYTLFKKYYTGNRRMKEIVGMIFLVFFAYQALASFLVTICEDCEFWNTLPKGEGVYINILHRCLLFILRISVRIIAPLCSLFQLHWIAVKPQLTSTSGDRQEPDKSLHEFEGSLQRRIESTWITVVHAALFPILLLFMGAFAGVEESLTKAKVCDFFDSSNVAVPLNVFIQVCDCISTFIILLVMGLAKDCYCYENKIATHLLTFGNSGQEICKKIRNRWLILDIYCYITSVGFTVFTGLSVLAGKAFTPDPSQDLDVDDLVTWYFWISFLTLLLYLGFASPRYVKGAGLACYGLALILMLVSKMPIHVPPGSSVILIYITLGVSVFNLLVSLFCSRCRQRKSKQPFSRALFVLCLFCLLLLPVSGLAMLFREVIHFAHFVVSSK